MMKSYWVVCINSKGTKYLQKEMKYLVTPIRTKVKILRSLNNPYLRLGSYNRDRFKLIT